MERGKTGGGRGKNKIAPHPSDFFALGTKNSRDVPDPKRPGPNLTKAPTVSSATVNDRKKEGSTIQSHIPTKKPKLATLPTAPTRPTVSYTEAWEVIAIDCDPADLVPSVLEANDSDDAEKLMGLTRPSIFSHHCILHALASLLKRDQSHNFNNKGNPLVPVLVCILLMRGFHDKKEWPDVFIKIYIEDALGERVVPSKSVLQPELSVMTPSYCNSPSILLDDEDSATSLLQISGDEEKLDLPEIPRDTHCPDVVENIVLEVVKEQLNRRQPETITRTFLKLLSTACGFVDMRNSVVPKLEMWLHNPKSMRPAQELLSYVCYNCITHIQRDVEVISQLVKMRLKTKAVINLYLNGVKELIGLYSENLSTAISKHTIYNELSNARNLNNMPMISVIFQNAPDASAKLLAEIFQDLLLN
ncbi:hypothetical protein QAD02_002340 [Eretmocerus hayati]|uniref:Uncharacterized protein n=1 Tax=Eretmocerus hayati TaxID=131215 RepID=A0ACC2NKC4_9HYME|nr:hypothetical protein QAD02_002340 [Eretmocerus hayati]